MDAIWAVIDFVYHFIGWSQCPCDANCGPVLNACNCDYHGGGI